MKNIKIKNLDKSYGETKVIEGLDLDINAGERLVLLGPSGCGKSTLLRMIAGLEDITAGDLYFGDERVNGVEAGDREVAMVFQNYALYPHFTVKDNITFALKMNKLPKEEIESRAEKAIEILNLSGLEKRYPRELSGGQRQRVSLARAVVKQSPVFLLDEPLSNLDVQLRNSSREELVKLHNIFNPTFIYVTHDQIEAMTIGQRIVVLNKGKIQQVDTPSNIYNNPANTFVAKFIGTPPMNLLDISNEKGKFTINGTTHSIGGNGFDEKELILGVRSEDIKISTNKSEGNIEGKVLFVENYGSQKCIKVDLGEQTILVSVDNEMDIMNGERVYLSLRHDKMHIFSKETGLNLGKYKSLKGYSKDVISNVG